MELRRFIFNLRAISDYQSTPPSLLRKAGEQYNWYRVISLEVNLPPEQQLVAHYPEVVSRIIKEMPQLSVNQGGLIYGNNRDFIRELRKKNGITLGVLWKQIAAQSFDDVSRRLGYGDHQFRWWVDISKTESDQTIYSVFCCHEEKPPSEFFGFEGVVTGYLNALMEDKPFSLANHLKDFVRHRTAFGEDHPIGLCQLAS